MPLGVSAVPLIILLMVCQFQSEIWSHVWADKKKKTGTSNFENFDEEPYVCCLTQLFKSKKVRQAEATTDTVAHECADSLLVDRTGEAPPSTGSTQQLGNDN